MISIAKFYRKQVKILIRSISVLMKNHNAGTIHHLRVAYKRIRAINKFIKRDLDNNNIFDDNFERLDRFYKVTGKIREIQINLNQINYYSKLLDESYDEFSAFLDIEMAKIKHELSVLVKEIDINATRKAEDDIKQYLDNISEFDLRIKGIRFIKKKSRKIDSVIHSKTDGEKYHEIRTHIKDAFFFINLLFEKKDFKKSGFKASQLKRIWISLGEWHDKDILATNLYSYFKIKHITNYKTPNSKYKVLIDQIHSEQSNIIKNCSHRIVKTNLKLACFVGEKELKLINVI